MEEFLLGPALCEDRLLRRLSRSLMFFLMDCWVLEVLEVVWYSVVYRSLELKAVEDLETDLTLAMLERSETKLSDRPLMVSGSVLFSETKQR